MSDDVTDELQSQLEAEESGPRPDVEWVVGRGRRLRTIRRAVAAASFFGIGVLAVGIALFATGESTTQPTDNERPAQEPPVLADLPGEEVIEEISEQHRAEVFAFRALDTTGLMDPLGARTFSFAGDKHTARAGRAWRIAFVASDCAPRESSQTCRPISGEEDKAGFGVPDTYVEVAVENGSWVVTDVEGAMFPDERERLVGYTLPDRDEPSHWEFAAGVAPNIGPEGWDLTNTSALWVGPFPTSARGSVCQTTYLDEHGYAVGEAWLFYAEPPREADDVSGWGRGTDAPVPADVRDVEVDCRQYAGPGWEITGEPQMRRSDYSKTILVVATLTWRGPEGFTSAARCETTLVDNDGEVVWEGSGRVEPLWRPGELSNYPYDTKVYVHAGGSASEAEAIGDFDCQSL